MQTSEVVEMISSCEQFLHQQLSQAGITEVYSGEAPENPDNTGVYAKLRKQKQETLLHDGSKVACYNNLPTGKRIKHLRKYLRELFYQVSFCGPSAEAVEAAYTRFLANLDGKFCDAAGYLVEVNAIAADDLSPQEKSLAIKFTGGIYVQKETKLFSTMQIDPDLILPEQEEV